MRKKSSTGRNGLTLSLAAAACLTFSALQAVPLAAFDLARPAQAQGEAEVHRQEQANPVTATLISDSSGIVAGGKFKLGVKFAIQPGWHTYYKDPGDSGMPPSFDWELPPGFSAGPTIWAKPVKTVDEGLVAYGYSNAVLHASEITVPANLKEGDKLTIKVKVKYLVCKDVCLPGKAALEITLPVVKTAAKSAEASEFEALGAGFSDPVSTLQVSTDGGHSTTVAAAQSTGTSGPGGGGAGTTGGGINGGGASGGKFSVLDQNLAVPQSEEHGDLLKYIAFAFIGGLILNIMPCVLPVIAIKVLSILEQAKEEPAKVKLLGLVFSGGIVSSFMVLALAAIGLKLAGQAVGWGFQFQYPGFVLAMCAVILMMALSLFGLFDVNVQASGSIDKLSRQEGLVGTFFKGVLATILSTPCSAPFLGVALGFAFSQPAATIALMFFTISLGMASPYLLLTINPAWMKFLPKPGDWMVKFKQSMGFLMLLTVIWLDYVLSTQISPEALGWVNAWLVGLSFCAWIVASFSDLTSSKERRMKVLGVFVGCLALFSYGCIFAQPGVVAALVPDSQGVKKTASAEEGGAGIVWQPFTLDSLNKDLEDKKTVFLDFTADWCLTCKANEKAVIATPEVADKFKALNVVTMKADWTRQDPEITKLLSKFNRSGVPLYVIFPGGRPDKPIVFPEVITKEMVLAKLDESAK